MTRSQFSRPDEDEGERSEKEDVYMDWLWPSTLSETATSLPCETDTGTLRPETPQFIPQSKSLEVQECFPTSLTVGEIEISHPSIEPDETSEPKVQRTN